jgi:uncharacterized heparinase superfamily protein
MELYRRINRYWNTVRYLRPSQVISRVDLRLRAAARSLSPGRARARYSAHATRAALAFDEDPWKLRGSAPLAADLLAPSTLATARLHVAGAADGAFEFLNDRRELGNPVDWTAADAPQLWRYHLHYFDYAADLTITGAADAAASLMTDWIRRVPMADASSRDAWHPYVVSLRLVNWMIALAASPRDLPRREGILESLRIQTLFVRDNLETDVGGNHLLKNLKALAIAGCFWTGETARQMRMFFTNEFVRALHAQLRSDGGHYEQSPMYHAQVLADAVELAFVLRQSGAADAELERQIARMEAFLRRVCHPDGQLAQFGDTAAGMTPEPDALVAACGLLRDSDPDRRLAPRHALLASVLTQRVRAGIAGAAPSSPEQGGNERGALESWDPDSSGFVTLATADERGFLIADAGPVCPEDLPAHAHSDTFGFEVSVDTLRMVVDSGVSQYASGPLRDYYRSTRAHSTVMVDGAEQSECWSSFRVGRRAHVVDGRREKTALARGFSAAHTGFDHLSPGVRHRRRFLLVAGRAWLIVDELLGEGQHRWETFLHLHPDVQFESRQSGHAIRRGDASLGIAWFGVAPPHLVTGQESPLQGWYAPAFGRDVPSPTLVSAGSGPLPVCFGWLLVPGARMTQEFHVTAGPGALIVTIANDTFTISVDLLLKHRS